MTAKQSRFVDAYLLSGNATKAAIEAGYSQKTARAIASEALRKPAVAAAIESGRMARRQLSEASSALLVAELTKLAFADLRLIFDKKGKLKHPSQWPEEFKSAVEFTFEERYAKGADGRRRLVKSTQKLRMPYKLKALNLLAKHLGIVPSGSLAHRRAGGSEAECLPLQIIEAAG